MGDTVMRPLPNCTGANCNVQINNTTKIYVRAIVGGVEQVKNVAITTDSTAEPTLVASIECTPGDKIRGATVECKASSNVPNSTFSEWKFNGSGFSRSGSGTTDAWQGSVVAPGAVSVKVTTPSSQAATVTTSFQIIPRTTGQWVWGSGWSIGELDGDPCGVQGATWAEMLDPSLEVPWGWNKSNRTCDIDSLHPGANDTITDSGFSVGVGTGPNQNIYYVGGNWFYIDSHTQIQRELHEEGPVHTVTDGQAYACRERRGDAVPNGDPLAVNAHVFNNLCVVGSDWNVMRSNVIAHEAFHHELTLQAARQPDNDMKQVTEFILGADTELVKQRVKTAYATADRQIREGGDPGHTNSRWQAYTVSFWAWFESDKQYRQVSGEFRRVLP